MNDILLVIDMQNVYKEGQPWGCPNINNIINKITGLIDSAVFASVFFTRHLPSDTPAGTWRQYNNHYNQINAAADLNQIIDELKPYTRNHTVITKSTYSVVPALPPGIFREPMPRIVITGVVAQCCVLSTVMGLIDKGSEIIFLKDAVAGSHLDFEGMTSDIIESFAPIHTAVMTVKDYLASCKN